MPADVFYEWAGEKPRRQPYAIQTRDGAPFCFAGLWDAWRDPRAKKNAPWVATCALITTTPNALLAKIHDRMPVILPREAYEFWLDPDTPAAMAAEVLEPYPAEAMEAVPITTYVNDPRHDDPGVLTPA